MRRRKQLPPSRLADLGDFRTFDQGNGLAAASIAEERYSESAHTVAPERLNGISLHFH